MTDTLPCGHPHGPPLPDFEGEPPSDGITQYCPFCEYEARIQRLEDALEEERHRSQYYATLRFRPDQEYELRMATRAVDLALLIWRLDEHYLRGMVKHGHHFDSADEALRAVRDRIREDVHEIGLTLDALGG